MKILFYGDLQINATKPEYFANLEKTLAYLHDVIQKVQPDLVVNLGDTMDTFGVVDVESLLFGHRWMGAISAVAHSSSKVLKYSLPKHIILKGNHDISDREAHLASVKVFDDGDQTEVVTGFVPNLNDLGIMAIPYTHDVEGLKAQLAEVAKSGYKPLVAIGHMDWIGPELTPSYSSKFGLDPAWFKETFPGLKVFNGHYHHPSYFDPVYFVGSPLYMDFSDRVSTEPRGFALWDSDKPESIQRIENPHTYYTIQVEAEEEKELKEKLSQIVPPLEKCKVKLHIPTKLTDMALKLKSMFLWMGICPTDEVTESMEHRVQVSVRTDVYDALERAVASAPEDMDKTKLAELGLEAFGLNA